MLEITPASEISNDIRGAYADFLNGDAGKDFLVRLVQMEASFQAEGYSTKDFQAKALCMEKIGLLYQIRTILSDLSKPPTKQNQKPKNKDLRG